MLHILLLILKIIGILLAVLLGLILLLLLIVLFVPFRYYAYGSKRGDNLQGKVKVSWLFHGISFAVEYKDKTAITDIRILGIPLDKLSSFFQHFKRKGRPSKTQEATCQLQSESETIIKPNIDLNTDLSTDLKIEKHAELKKQNTVQSSTYAPEIPSEHMPGTLDSVSGRESRKSETVVIKVQEELDNKDEDFVSSPKEKISIWSRIKEMFGRIIHLVKSIAGIPAKIIGFFKNIALTIQSVCAKISYWKEFMADERTKEAIRLCRKTIGKILHHIMPRTVKGELVFGFEDPYTTGQLLAGICAFYPLYQDHILISPMFDQEILEGELTVKGRIYTFVFVYLAVKLYFDSNIKFVINRFQHKEEA